MAQPHGIVKGDALQKISSAAFIIGAILLGGSGLLMPNAGKSTSDLHEMLIPLGTHEIRTTVASLLMVIGFWAVLIGAAGVYRAINASRAPGTVWARLGFYLTIGGTVLWTISLAGDVATARLVANWLAAPADAKDALWNIITAFSASGRALLALTWIIDWLAITFLALGMIGSAIYPRWLGWSGFSVSLPVIALGVIQIFMERSTVLTLVFALLLLLTTLWDLAMGIWVARKAW